MSFVYPAFLSGLIALAIPIIIHLFNFRKARRIYFSNNQFLRNVKKASSTKLKIKHYLILAARLLFLFFLVITFAQPYIPAKEKTTQSNQVIIYLDNSFSMSNYVGEDLTAFEAAITYIQSLLEIYPQNTQIRLITNEFAPFSNTAKSERDINELITEINLTGINRTVDDVLERVKNTSNTSSAKDIYWISDFQKSTSGDLNRFQQDTTDNIYIIPMQFTNTENVFIDSLYLSNPFLIQGEKNELNVILRNEGDQNIDDMMVKFFVNNVQSASGTVDIGPGNEGKMTFDISYDLNKYNRCRISFEEFPVTFDNDFYFTLTLADRISVVELKQTGEATPVEKVFGNQKIFNFRSYNTSNIDYNDLQNANLIILNQIRDLDPTISNVLTQFLRRKGDILLIPAAEMDLNSYQAFPGTLEMIPDSSRLSLPMASPQLENPFFSDIFENQKGNFDMPSATPVIRQPLTSNKLISFRNGESFLSYLETDNRFYVLASPLLSGYTTFQSHAIFVPVMYRIAMLSKKVFNPLYYNLNAPVVSVNVDSVGQESLIRLKGNNKEIIPGQHISGNIAFMEIPKFELEPGFYDIETNERYSGTIAFNMPSDESYLEQYSEEDLENIVSENSNLTLFNTKGINNFDKEIKQNYLGVPLWRYALALALIFLLAEVMFIRFL